MSEISELYKEISIKVFNQTALRGTTNLVWSHSYYDTALWEETLKQQFGEENLIKTARDPNSPKVSCTLIFLLIFFIFFFILLNYFFFHCVNSSQ